MNTWMMVVGVGAVLMTSWCHAAGSASTNLLSKAQLKQLDKNGNNILDYKELNGLPKAQCEAALDAYDVNSDGEITATELERVPRTKEDMEKEAKRLQQEKQKQAAAKKAQEQKKVQEQKKPQEKKKPEPKKPEPKKPEAKKPVPPKPDPKKNEKK